MPQRSLSRRIAVLDGVRVRLIHLLTVEGLTPTSRANARMDHRFCRMTSTIAVGPASLDSSTGAGCTWVEKLSTR